MTPTTTIAVENAYRYNTIEIDAEQQRSDSAGTETVALSAVAVVKLESVASLLLSE
jgi:hypothetical protein